MDNTFIYIKMCKKAIEVQALWKQERGDMVYPYGMFMMTTLNSDNTKTYTFTMARDMGGGNVVYVDDKSIVWLPNQDQLQEILGKSVSYNIIGFYKYVKHEGQSNNPSMEQLWLAFVMKEKFNKTWNGEKWINL